VTFHRRDKIKDSNWNDLSTYKVQTQDTFFYVFLSDEEKRIAAIQSDVSLTSLVMAFLTSTLVTLVLGTQIEATWLLLGTIQLMSLVPLFNLNIPSNFREFSKNLAILHGEPESIPNVFETVVDKEGLKPFNRFFEMMSECCLLTYRLQDQLAADERGSQINDMDSNASDHGWVPLKLYIFILRWLTKL